MPEAHQLGDIHIHDLDYYPTKTTTCIQYDLNDLFERGFHRKTEASVRLSLSKAMPHWPPLSVQTNQNEQHGGQAIPAFSFFMAKGVLKTFQKSVSSTLSFLLEIKGIDIDDKQLLDLTRKELLSIRPDETSKKKFLEAFTTAFNSLNRRGTFTHLT